jgi:hypothetical protein
MRIDGNGVTFYGNVSQAVATAGTAASTTIDWNVGTVQSSAHLCAGATDFILDGNKLLTGGSYTLMVSGDATGAQCDFGMLNGITTLKWLPANSARVPTKDTIYTFTRIGAIVYISWSSGYQ